MPSICNFVAALLFNCACCAGAALFSQVEQWLPAWCGCGVSTSEVAGSRSIRGSAEWSLGDAGTVVLSFSSIHIVMLDGVLRVAVVECSIHGADCGEAVVSVASVAAHGTCSMELWPWWTADHSQALVLVRLYACL